VNDHPIPQTQHGALAEELHALRQRTGLSGKEFAAQVGWAPSKVSRLENAKQMPSRADIDVWVEACDAAAEEAADLRSLLRDSQTDRQEWRRRLRRGLAAVQVDYNQLVADASEIRYFETAVIPGFLQTAAYARRILAEMSELHGLPAGDDDAAVAARLRRQQHLYDVTKRFTFVLAEPVLRWGLCPPEVMRPQLDRLLNAAELPNVELLILPLGVKLATTPQHAFQLYDEVAIVDTATTELVFREDEAAAYLRLFDRLAAEALGGDHARRLISDAVAGLGRANGSLVDAPGRVAAGPQDLRS